MEEEREPVTQAQMQEALGKAIEQVVGELEGGFTMKWVTIIESVEADGSRGAWAIASPGCFRWDTLGLLDYGLTVEKAKIADWVMG